MIALDYAGIREAVESGIRRGLITPPATGIPKPPQRPVARRLRRGRPPKGALANKKLCPKCGRLATTIHGRIVIHRMHENRAGRGTGAICLYDEVRGPIGRVRGRP